MSQFTSDEFLKGFLIEADEYLQIIVRVLLYFDKSTPKAKSKRKALTTDQEETLANINELLRALHSLKGISGMVGLTQAADLCHAMESIVKPVQQTQQEISQEMVEQLLETAKLLERVIQTVRDPEAQMPDIQPRLDQLQELLQRSQSKTHAAGEAPKPIPLIPENRFQKILPVEIASHLGPLEWQKIQTALASEEEIALVYYSPSLQPPGQATSVSEVREKLNRSATLIKAVPIIQDGNIRFAFVVVSRTIPSDPDLAFLDWQPINKSAVKAEVGELSHPKENPLPVPVSAASALSSSYIRVDLGRMDDLMDLVGDLVVTRSRISDMLPRLVGAPQAALEGLEEASEKLERQVRYLRQAVMRARLVPLSDVLSRMPLTVRDLSRTTGKKIQLLMEGGETEMDKALVERLADPLMHLVRNAITHGIETPEERVAAGKAPEGSIRITGTTEGDRVLIYIEDDGLGIDEQKVREKMRGLGWLEDDHPLNNQELLEVICRPGFSTQESADLGSGRGMGMNAAAEAIASMGGSLSLDTWPGKGTRFTIRLPLTLTIIDAFIIEAGGERYAIPQSMINEVIEVEPERVTHVLQHDLLPYRGGSIPLIALHKLFGVQPQTNRLKGLVVGSQNDQSAILVDQVVGLREAVVRPLSDPMITEPGVSGATELGDGSVILVLDCNRLVHRSLEAHER